MISYVKGELAEVSSDFIVVEAGGIGYEIRVPQSMAANLPDPGRQVKIYTHFLVREDAVSLCGFLQRDELEMFRNLLTVNGVGPKVALGVLSVLSADDLRFAILSGDEKAISRAPGMGKKTAQKVILELKDKLDLGDAFALRQEHAAASRTSDAVNEAVEALTALGYPASDSLRVVRGGNCDPKYQKRDFSAAERTGRQPVLRVDRSTDARRYLRNDCAGQSASCRRACLDGRISLPCQ